MEHFHLPTCQNEPMMSRVMLPWKYSICFVLGFLYQLTGYILRTGTTHVISLAIDEP